MATLTATLRTDVQGDLGIGSDQGVFTDDELDRLYTRADSDYGTTIYLAFRQLLADAAKFNDYTAGHTSEKKSQLWDHLKEMVAFWREESRSASNQVRFVGATEIPPRRKSTPESAQARRTIYEVNRQI